MAQPSAPEAPPAAAPSSGKGMWIGLIVVVIVIVILLAAVFGGLLGPPEERVLKIGTVMSITGGLAAFGSKNRQGVILAATEINNQGGVLGQPIILYHQNDDTKADTARSAAATLVAQSHVDAIIGATGSGQCSTVIEVAKANSVFEVSGSCTSPKFSNLTLTGGWWARTAPSDALQGVVAASYARTNLTLSRAGVFGINNAYGTGLAGVFAGKFTRLGGTIVCATPPCQPEIITEVQNGATDYTTNLHAVLDANPAPQIVYVVAYPPDGLLLMRNWHTGLAANPGWRNIRWLFSEGVYDQAQFLTPARIGADNQTGTADDIDISAWEGTAPSAYGGITGPNYASWSTNYSRAFSGSPGLFDDNYYDAAYLIALAAQKAGTATGAGIKAHISEIANPPGVKIYPGMWRQAVDNISKGIDIDYQGASGAVDIDSFGDPLSGYIVWGVNATGGAVTNEVFPESLVVSLLPAPPAPVPPVPGTRSDFLSDLVALADDR